MPAEQQQAAVHNHTVNTPAHQEQGYARHPSCLLQSVMNTVVQQVSCQAVLSRIAAAGGIAD